MRVINRAASAVASGVEATHGLSPSLFYNLNETRPFPRRHARMTCSSHSLHKETRDRTVVSLEEVVRLYYIIAVTADLALLTGMPGIHPFSNRLSANSFHALGAVRKF